MEKELKQLIIEMVNQVEGRKMLERIYTFIKYLPKDKKHA